MRPSVIFALAFAVSGCSASLVEVTPSQLSRAPSLPEPAVHIVNADDEDLEVRNAFATGCESDTSPCVVVGMVEGHRRELDLSALGLKRARVAAIFAERKTDDGGKGSGRALGWVLFGMSVAALVVGSFCFAFGGGGFRF